MILCRTLSRQCGCNLERWEYVLPINNLFLFRTWSRNGMEREKRVK